MEEATERLNFYCDLPTFSHFQDLFIIKAVI